jgi:phosphinothricin acetyltransferase
MKIRLATEVATPAVQAIYAPIVRGTIISYEYKSPTVDEVRRRIAKTLKRYPSDSQSEIPA